MRIFPLGDEAMLVELGDRIDEDTHHRVQRAWRILASAQLPGVREIVPAYTSIALFYDPIQLAQVHTPFDKLFDWLASKVRTLLTRMTDATEPAGLHRSVEIPVCYDGSFAPDLAEVASETHLNPDEVVSLHHSAVYFVHLIGFAPGFPYLGGLPSALRVRRHSQPRAKVPAGSVGIAGEQAGIYPLESPGGWKLIGRTPLRLFRAELNPPSFLQPGDRVRFVPISLLEYNRLVAVS
jgi:inhibitor of KinA